MCFVWLDAALRRLVTMLRGPTIIFVVLATLVVTPPSRARVETKNDIRYNDDLNMWIDAKQVKMFSGAPMEICVICVGMVVDHIRDPDFERYLPVIPSEVSSVNFTWRAGNKKYIYDFNLLSLDENILKSPEISIKTKGRVPRRAKEFSLLLPCMGNSSGTAYFEVGLHIHDGITRQPLLGTPLRLKLRKECGQRSPDPECDKKCANQGRCNEHKICQCPDGYMGQYCRTALCYPQCWNGGNCTSPGVCSCPSGFQGGHCEGGICTLNCFNGGKCVQKDKCHCSKGFYGPRCEFSKCSIPCLNGGRCKDANKCKCTKYFGGDHCEIELQQRRLLTDHGGTYRRRSRTRGGGGVAVAEERCQPPCKHGQCINGEVCHCAEGWYGRACHHRAM